MDSDEGPRISIKRKKAVIESSSDDEEINESNLNTPDNSGITKTESGSGSSSTRSSSRIAKRNSQSFEMPTRDRVWKSIPSVKSPDKYRHLTPRRLVNNFTRENHRYNYDPNYTSGEESMDDFIVDAEEPVVDSSNSDSSSSDEEQRKVEGSGKKRVINYKKRVIIEDSDSDSETKENVDCENIGSEDTEANNGKNNKRRNVQKRTHNRGAEKGNSTSTSNPKKSKTLPEKSKCSVKSHVVDSSSSELESETEEVLEDVKNGESSDDDIHVTPCRKRCNGNVIESDEGTDGEVQTGVPIQVTRDGVSSASEQGVEGEKEDKASIGKEQCVTKGKSLVNGKKQNKIESDSELSDVESTWTNNNFDSGTHNNAGTHSTNECVDKDKESIKPHNNQSVLSETIDLESDTTNASLSDSDAEPEESECSGGKLKDKEKPKNAKNSLELLRKLVGNLDKVNNYSDTTESDSGSEDESDSSDDEEDESGEDTEGGQSESENMKSKARMVKKKKAKLQLFEKFREARKRKLSKEQNIE